LQATEAYTQAVDHYQTALALGEPQTSTLVNLAIAYYEAGEPVKAADAAREALLYDDSLAPAYTVLGAVALELRQPEEALSTLNRAITLDPSYGQAYFYLGLAYKALDQPSQAIGAFEQALVSAQDEVMRVRIRRHLNELYEVEQQSRIP
jgi:tetratricopeptide (TPR) repeat protein